MSNRSLVTAHVEMRGNTVAASCPSDSQLETGGNSVVQGCLIRVVDATPDQRKQIAGKCQVSDTYLSKALNSPSAFATVLDRLPRELRGAWLKELGERWGYAIRELDPGELTEEVAATLERALFLVRTRLQLPTRATRMAQMKESR